MGFFFFFFLAGPELVNSVQERNSMVADGILEKAKSICASHGVNNFFFFFFLLILMMNSRGIHLKFCFFFSSSFAQINAETISVVGGAKKAICEGVKNYKINLLVLGDHGTGKFKRSVFFFTSIQM